jgi:hypothetical protein
MNVVYVPVSHTKISSGCTIADTITQFFCCPRTFRPILKPQQPGRRFRTPGRRGSPDAKEPRLCVGGRGDCRPAVWGAWWPRLGHPPCRCPRRIALPRSGGRKQPVDRLAYQAPRRIALPRSGRGESTGLITWLISHQSAVFSLRINQSPTTNQQYFSLVTNYRPPAAARWPSRAHDMPRAEQRVSRSPGGPWPPDPDRPPAREPSDGGVRAGRCLGSPCGSCGLSPWRSRGRGVPSACWSPRRPRRSFVRPPHELTLRAAEGGHAGCAA